jgi:hypothetical protein
MNLICLCYRLWFGVHRWNRCICTLCGKTRDEGHDWSKDCEKCVRCGMTQQDAHRWNRCICTLCGKTRDEGHDWSKDCEKCVRCGKTRQDDHTWKGCKCITCGKTRDEGHDWSKDCEICATCYMTQQDAHTWDGSTCTTCGRRWEKIFSVYYPDGYLGKKEWEVKAERYERRGDLKTGLKYEYVFFDVLGRKVKTLPMHGALNNGPWEIEPPQPKPKLALVRFESGCPRCPRGTGKSMNIQLQWSTARSNPGEWEHLGSFRCPHCDSLFSVHAPGNPDIRELYWSYVEPDKHWVFWQTADCKHCGGKLTVHMEKFEGSDRLSHYIGQCSMCSETQDNY